MTAKTPYTEYIPICTGRYSAKIINVKYNDSGQYRPQYRQEFNLLEHNNQSIVAWASAKFSPKSKLFEWAKNPLEESYLRKIMVLILLTTAA